MISQAPTQISEKTADPAVLNAAEGLLNPQKTLDLKWDFGNKNHIKNVKAFETLVKLLSESITLNTYKIENTSRVLSASIQVPRYFAIGVDTETTGTRIGVSESTFLKHFEKSKLEKFNFVLNEQEFTDLSRYLRLIQIGIIEPRISEETYSENGQEFIREVVSVSFNDKGQSFLIYVSDLELELSTTKDCNAWASQLKTILEDPRRTLFIMNASFEHRQFAAYGISINNVIDNMLQAKQLRQESRSVASFKDDIENNLLEDLTHPGSFSMAAIGSTIFNLPVSKEQQSSAWDSYRYENAQIEYASGDPERSLRFGIYLQAILNQQDNEIKREIDAFNFDKLDPVSAEFKNQLTELIDYLGNLYLLKAKTLHSSAAYDEIMQLHATEKFLAQQLKELVLPVLFEQECRKFDSLNAVPVGFALRFETNSGSCSFEPTTKRNINLAAVSVFGENVLSQVQLSLSKENLRQASLSAQQLKTLQSELFQHCRLESKLGLAYPVKFMQTASEIGLTTNHKLQEVKQILALDKTSVSQETVADHLFKIVQARTVRMELLNQNAFCGNQVGLINRKIMKFRELLKSQLVRVACAKGFHSDQVYRDFHHTSAKGRAWIASGTRANFDLAKLLYLVKNSQLPTQVLDLISPQISVSTLDRIFDNNGVDAKFRSAMIESALPVQAYSLERHARIWPKYMGAYG